jgi:beta propeller repeat protein
MAALRSAFVILTVGGMLAAVGGAAWAASAFPICTHPADQYGPDVSGNIVVWTDSRNDPGDRSNLDIYGYDLSTHTEFPICAAPGSQESPAISGNIVVWEDRRNSAATGSDIYAYDVAAYAEFPVCTAPDDQKEPAISGNIVVWTDNRNRSTTGPDIYGHNLSTHLEFQVVVAAGDQGNPDVSGNIVVWASPTCATAPQGDIFGRNLLTGQGLNICSAPRAQWYPAICGNLVLWQDHRYDETADPSYYGGLFLHAEIYAYDLSTRQEFFMADEGYLPDISDNLAAWEDTRNGQQCYDGVLRWWCQKEIWAWNRSTSRQFFVGATSEYGAPASSGNTIVWTAGSWPQRDIWAYVVTPLPAPGNLRITAVTPYRIDLAWKDNSSDEAGFQILWDVWGIGGGIRHLPANTTTFSFTEGLWRGVTFVFKVRAYREDTYSAFSNAVSATIPLFDDVRTSDPFWRYVEALARNAITNGCSAEPPLFCPYASITRAQTAVFLCKAAGKVPLNRDTPTFCDVQKTHPCYGWIERLADADSWNGNPPTMGCAALPCRKYCPSGAVLRDEMAAFLVRATGHTPMPSCGAVFCDVSKGGWACPYIERLIDAYSWPRGVAVTTGCVCPPAYGECWCYCPNANVSRGQMAVFLVRAFGIPL